MNIINMLLNDPVVLSAFIGLGILLGIGAFYIYYFMTKINENN